MGGILVTGSAGFIGFHLCSLLLQLGYKVVGVDNFDKYYDVKLKQDRVTILNQFEKYTHLEIDISKQEFVEVCCSENPEVIVHLAAQAGVRYSIEYPQPYITTNLVGTFNVLELARSLKVKHLLMASTSSVYGANKEMPFDELQKCDNQISLYAATKKSTEVMAHSYSHLYNIPVTMFRFFTVYGPWGRPDMALFKFTKSIIEDEAIEIYNKGQMTRDFTYVEDLVSSIKNLIGVVPNLEVGKLSDIDSLSPVAPWRVVNIGNSDSVPLMEYVEALEAVLGKSARKHYLGMQAGDVQDTLSDVKLLQLLTGSTPNTPIKTGVRKFVDWYLDYYDVSN